MGSTIWGWQNHEVLSLYPLPPLVLDRLLHRGALTNAADARGWANALLSVNSCGQDSGPLVRPCIGFASLMTKQPGAISRRCMPDIPGFKCAQL
jgi:hypothetical protein